MLCCLYLLFSTIFYYLRKLISASRAKELKSKDLCRFDLFESFTFRFIWLIFGIKFFLSNFSLQISKILGSPLLNFFFSSSQYAVVISLRMLFSRYLFVLSELYPNPDISLKTSGSIGIVSYPIITPQHESYLELLYHLCSLIYFKEILFLGSTQSIREIKSFSSFEIFLLITYIPDLILLYRIDVLSS